MRWPKPVKLASLSLAMFFATTLSSAQSSSFVHQKRYAMGTVFEIVIDDDDLSEADVAARAALDEAVRLDTVMSNYKPESELSRLNRAAHFQPVRISHELYEVIDQSLSYSRISDGQFDISVGPVVDLWKAVLAGGSPPTAAQQAAALRCVGYQKIELMPPDRIQFHSACMRLDLGAIGKGYAVDRMADLLRARGIRRAYIDAGGSTLCAINASPRAKAWNVHLRDPSRKLDPQIMMMNGSVSTSEQSAASVLQKDAPGHIVMPGTGKPLQTRYAVSVTAASATASDALSTTLLLLGPKKGVTLVKTLQGVSAIWIDSGGHRTVAGQSAAFHFAGEDGSSGRPDATEMLIEAAKAGKELRQ